MAHQSLTVTWFGHSCFLIDNGRWKLVLDPYRSEMIGYPPLNVSAHAILASHDHADHNERRAVSLIKSKEDLIIPVEAQQPWLPEVDADFFQVRTVFSFHDTEQGASRGANRIHVIRTAGQTIAHLGDLGHDLDEQQLKAIGPVDLLLIPVGGYYTIDAKKAAALVQKLKPRTVAPMHYQIGFGTLPIARVDDFLDQIRECYTVHDLQGSVLQLHQRDSSVCYLFHYNNKQS